MGGKVTAENTPWNNKWKRLSRRISKNSRIHSYTRSGLTQFGKSCFRDLWHSPICVHCTSENYAWFDGSLLSVFMKPCMLHVDERKSIYFAIIVLTCAVDHSFQGPINLILTSNYKSQKKLVLLYNVSPLIGIINIFLFYRKLMNTRKHRAARDWDIHFWKNPEIFSLDFPGYRTGFFGL